MSVISKLSVTYDQSQLTSISYLFTRLFFILSNLSLLFSFSPHSHGLSASDDLTTSWLLNLWGVLRHLAKELTPQVLTNTYWQVHFELYSGQLVISANSFRNVSRLSVYFNRLPFLSWQLKFWLVHSYQLSYANPFIGGPTDKQKGAILTLTHWLAAKLRKLTWDYTAFA